MGVFVLVSGYLHTEWYIVFLAEDTIFGISTMEGPSVTAEKWDFGGLVVLIDWVGVRICLQSVRSAIVVRRKHDSRVITGQIGRYPGTGYLFHKF